MLKKSNILALVGGGKLPKFSENKITIWDDHQGIVIRQIRLNSNLIKVKIREDTIIGIIIDKIYIININTLETIDILETFQNPNGIFSMSYNCSDFYIAFPHCKNKGKVQLEKYIISKGIHKHNEPKSINAHESNIAYITMNRDGTILATASDKGTLIRLFNIFKLEMITELRRGTKNVKINCLAFNIDTHYIGCTSDVGTVHIFDIHEVNKVIEKNEEKSNEDNKKEKAKFGKSYGFIKINERSFAKFKIQDPRTILGFCPKDSIVILSSNGKLQKASYELKSGRNCKKLEENFIKIVYN